MSEFDQFESAEQPQVEEDPAAAFLEREQNELAALEAEDFNTEPSADFAENEFNEQAPDAQAETDAALFDPLGDSPPETTDFFVAADDPNSLGEQQEEQEDGGFNDDPYNSIKQVDVQRAEPEKIRLWREAQVDILLKKDAESEVKSGEWRESAKKELEDWYKHRAEQLEKAKANNREGEEAFIQERDENVPGHEWERICRHCDFNPKSSRTNKDVSRMRSILLQLKQTPFNRA